MAESYNPFAQILVSFVALVSQEGYYSLRRQKTWSKLVCAIIVALLTSFITIGIGGWMISENRDLEEVMEQIPEFSYENGSLKVDGSFEACVDGQYFLLSTDIEYFNYGNDRKDYPTAINAEDVLALAAEQYTFSQAYLISEKNLVRISNIPSQNTSIKLSDMMRLFKINSLSKQGIVGNYKGVIIHWALIIALIWTPFKWVLLFFVPLLYGLIGLIVASILKSGDDFSDVYWISFYINIVFVIMKSVIGLFARRSIPWWIWVIVYLILIVLTLRQSNHHAQPAVAADRYAGNPYAGGSYPGNPNAGSYTGVSVQGQNKRPQTSGNTTMSMQADDDEFNAFMAQKDAEEGKQPAPDITEEAQSTETEAEQEPVYETYTRETSSDTWNRDTGIQGYAANDQNEESTTERFYHSEKHDEKNKSD